MVPVRIVRMHENQGGTMSAKESWIESVRGALDDSMTLPLKDYHEGLEEILDDVRDRFSLAADDLERAEARDEEE